jgi:hypothetical protein
MRPNPPEFDLPWWMFFVVLGSMFGLVVLLGVATATLHPPLIAFMIASGAGTLGVTKGLRTLATKVGTPPPRHSP